MASQICLSMAIVLGGVISWSGQLALAGVAAESTGPDDRQTHHGPGRAAIAQAEQSYTILHVNATAGDDTQGDGTQLRPLGTITRALQVAEPGTLILLAGGIYSVDSGETFPLQLRAGISVQGAAGPNTAAVIIFGGANYLSPSQGLQNVAILGSDNAGLADVTVSNPQPNGTGLWVETGSPIIQGNGFFQNGSTGIYLAGAGTPVIRDNYFSENGDAGLVIAGPSSAQVQGNTFENTGVGISVAPGATPQILNNRITQNLDGLVLHADARPILQNNQILRNRRNTILDYAPWSAVSPASGDRLTQPPPPTTPAPTVAQVGSDRLDSNDPPFALAPNLAPDQSARSPQRDSSANLSQEPEEAPSVEAAVAPEDLQSPIAVTPEPEPPTPSELEDLATDRPGQTLPALTTADIETIPPVSVIPALSDHAATVSPAQLPASAAAIPEAPLPEPLPAAIAPERLAALSEQTPEAIAIPIIPPPVEAIATPGSVPPNLSLNLSSSSSEEPIQAIGDLPELPPLAATASAAAAARISVPSSDIPTGSSGNLPRLFTLSSSELSESSAGPPPPPSLAATLGLTYRVLADATDPATQNQVRHHVPDAFRVDLNGQTYMQVGAYATVEEAQARAEYLNQQGLRVQVEHIP